MADGAQPRSRPVRWLSTVAVVVVTLLLLALFERLLGPRHFVFAFNLHFILMAAATALDQIRQPTLDSPRFDVSPRELGLYRRLGVHGFMRLLQRVGWTRMMRDPKIFDGTRATLASDRQATRHGEHAHACLFALVLAPMSYAALRGWWDAVARRDERRLSPVSVMLQRSQRARLRALLRRMHRPGACAGARRRRADAGDAGGAQVPASGRAAGRGARTPRGREKSNAREGVLARMSSEKPHIRVFEAWPDRRAYMHL